MLLRRGLERHVVHQGARSRLLTLWRDSEDVSATERHHDDAVFVQFGRRGDMVYHRQRQLRMLELRRDEMTMPPNHALQRTRPSRRGCNRTPSWAGSLSLGR